MEKIMVTSSNIYSIWYDEKEQILEIEFHSWDVYQYFNIPIIEYNDLMDASSHWRYLNYNIKWIYKYIKV